MARPQYLYKYRSLNGEHDWPRLHSIIVDSKLYFAAPESFNDPFDCAPVDSIEVTEEQMFCHIVRFLGEWQPNLTDSDKRAKAREIMSDPDGLRNRLKDSSADRKDNVGILCLAKSGENMLMWSHYANCHKGVCLKFEGEIFKKGDVIFDENVTYVKNRPVANVVIDEDADYFRHCFMCKHEDWGYEQEWRIVKYRTKKSALKVTSMTGRL